MVVDPQQIPLVDGLAPASAQAVEKPIVAHTRKAARPDVAADAEAVPFFDESKVPIIEVALSTPEAMRYNLKRGNAEMSNIRVAFNSGANNRWMTNRYAKRGGVEVVGYFDAPNDLVPQVVGLRAWARPDRIIRSMLSFPILFGPNSPHTYATEN